MKKILVALLIILYAGNSLAQSGLKILFDARRAQMAGNADWVIDADQYNIGSGSGGVMVTGQGNEANPARFPTPAQSGISASTPETFWKGGLSAWAVALVKRGFVVETLPFNGTLTYGNSANAQDLSNYKVFICVEPNIRFTAAEKTAILQFVQNGGGLFMGGNHNGSDRNNDGWDAPNIWNDFNTSNGVVNNPFGISFNLNNLSQTSTAVATIPSNSILNGAAGKPLRIKYSSGASMTLNKTVNANALGLFFTTGSSTTGSNNVLFAQSKYGTGRIAAIGDSSPSDDGTGDTNDQLYNGWSAEVSGDHSRLLINATLWLAGTAPRLSDNEPETGLKEWVLWPNPASEQLRITINSSVTENANLNIYDITGRLTATQQLLLNEGVNDLVIDIRDWRNGLYFAEMQGSGSRRMARILIQH